MRLKQAFRSAAARWISLIIATVLVPPAFSAEPPALINYQGVLRDSADDPLDGTYDLVFAFWSAAKFGDEILVDHHTSFYGDAVTITEGLFNVTLGTGHIQDGSGAGTYVSLAEVFRDCGAVYLEISVNKEILRPRVRVVSSGYALNADHLDGNSSDFFLNTSSGSQIKRGTLLIDVSGASYGLESYGGSGGGAFSDNNDSARAYIAKSNDGIRAEGSGAGGRFEHSEHPDWANAYIAWKGPEIDDYFGIRAIGRKAAGYFEVSYGADNSYAYIAREGTGIEAGGLSRGGFFKETDGSGRASVGTGDDGIRAYGDGAGGYFEDDTGAHAYVGYDYAGIAGWGSTNGGVFWNTETSSYARAGFDTYKVYGTGSVSFVQNHPRDSQRVIVYNALEGDEAATYTRGTARLVDGEARVSLGETFAWVTNPDVGLTVYVTPIGEWSDLFVAEKSTREIVVRSRDGAADAAFDYIVFGLRIGFEEIAIVQPKQTEAYIPSMKRHDERYAQHPELRRFNALERFQAYEARARGLAGMELDTDRAEELVAAIQVYDPALHGVVEAPKRPRLSLESGAASDPSGFAIDVQVSTGQDPGAGESSAPCPAHAGARSPDDGYRGTNENLFRADVSDTARIERLSRPAAETTTPGVPMMAIGPIEPGQVLAFDPEHPGAVHPATTMADPSVVGIALAATALEGSQEAAGRREVLVASGGLVECRVDAGYGAIQVGDLLTTSPTRGYAMRAVEARPGTILGKAAAPLDFGTGTIKVLVLPH